MRFLRFMLAFVLAFALAIPASAMTGKENEAVHYVALGDSLAAGMIQDGSIGKGYTGYLAEMLEADGLLLTYNNDFAVPGAKTTDILAALENDIVPPMPTAQEELTIKEVIKRADVITLSIGANDILSNVDIDLESGTLQFEQAQIVAAINTTKQNVNKILQQLDAINPELNVFVMGLYNPFPTLKDQAFALNILVNQIDTALKSVIQTNEYYFVPVKDAIAKDPATYIPNPLNIHPSDAGYKVIAEQFYGPVKSFIGLVDEPTVTDEPLPTFKDIKTEETALYAGKAAQYGIVKGLPDGTFNPNGELTRMQVTSMIVRLLGLTETAKVPYKDTTKLAAATQEELAKAYAAGLVPDAKTFKPGEKVSRLEVARMIDAAYSTVMGQPYRPDEMAPFTDISKLAREDQQIVTLLYDFEISTGSNGKFMPASTIKRSQAAKMFVVVKEKLAQ